MYVLSIFSLHWWVLTFSFSFLIVPVFLCVSSFFCFVFFHVLLVFVDCWILPASCMLVLLGLVGSTNISHTEARQQHTK
jgi:hypothetical protein